MSARGEAVVVAMSGGVDSSVAAALLKEQGWEVIGVTMQIWPSDEMARQANAARGCCSPDAVEDARRVANLLGIPHYVFDLRDAFQREVIDPFCSDYTSGVTPNPCIRCNRYIKFGALAERARKLGARYVATGHYARIERSPASGRWLIRAGVDSAKDQSYVLYSLEQEHLACALMPLGGLTKAEVRQRARDLGLGVAAKPESQELCFIAGKDYPAYLRRLLPGSTAPGPIVDSAGRRVGTHRGIACYTIGQRHGLGLSGAPQALYVIHIDANTNTVVVGPEQMLYHRRVVVGEPNYVALPQLQAPMRLSGKLRYRMKAQPCVLCGERDVLRADFDQAQRAPTPGQAAVFYDGDVVVCGGVIAPSVEFDGAARAEVAGRTAHGAWGQPARTEHRSRAAVTGGETS